LIVVITSIFMGTLMVISVAFAIADAVKKKGRPDRGSLDVLRRLEERMDRIEQGVEAVAVEVERISEGQRFATRLLSERAPERVGGDGS
jgi:hypothetical protein